MTRSLHAYHCLAQPAELLLACPVSPMLLKCPELRSRGHWLQRAFLKSSAGSTQSWIICRLQPRAQLHIRHGRLKGTVTYQTTRCFCKKTFFSRMPGHWLGCPVGSEGTNPWWVCLQGQHLCASPVALTGRAGCVGTENTPSGQGCKPLQNLFSGRATIEK